MAPFRRLRAFFHLGALRCQQLYSRLNRTKNINSSRDGCLVYLGLHIGRQVLRLTQKQVVPWNNKEGRYEQQSPTTSEEEKKYKWLGMGALSSQGCIMLPKANPSPSPGRPVVLVRSSSTQPVPWKLWFLEWHHDARSTLVRRGKMALYGRRL